MAARGTDKVPPRPGLLPPASLLLALALALLAACATTHAAPARKQAQHLVLKDILHRPVVVPKPDPLTGILSHDPRQVHVGGVFRQPPPGHLVQASTVFSVQSVSFRPVPATNTRTPPSSAPLVVQPAPPESAQFLQNDADKNATDPVLAVPDFTDKTTVIGMAKITANAYELPTGRGNWLPVDPLRTNMSFGWDDNGLRGYVYTTPNEDLAVITIKGTSAEFLGIGGDTATKDKFNDNSMFSCCCGRVDRSWWPVCGCYVKSGTCNAACLRDAATSYDSSYYEAGKDLYQVVTALYPRARVWFTGHSLGGALAGLLAATYPLVTAAVTYEAPGERLFAQRVGLTLPEDQTMLPIWHFGHNADPIFIGQCRGPRSSCYFAGYAMETKCHLGSVCMYKVRSGPVDDDDDEPEDDDDYYRYSSRQESQPSALWWWPWNPWPWPGNDDEPTPTSMPMEPTPTERAPPVLGWGVDIRHHRIHDVIDYVLDPWPYVPSCTPQKNCRDCAAWKFVEPDPDA
ncbi:hypothetical protein AMAG_05119 [Allomyces macrogynus ATCC 38327]|uniref:triacylglycerol lipase n=1 Tax=Allomyces macrogynus (strain ATCC 38327) TaxID=578462 RepID=A0A0L0S7B1_ALLM3|nr:hypothetical protein AMAG_05119 [Allomyces macrogynus ATCC 38327]|eukprot:KNE58311.1 hypothetical protein AMAG_05119 [Allomyces macrogynus ATCC 38327]